MRSKLKSADVTAEMIVRRSLQRVPRPILKLEGGWQGEFEVPIEG